MLLAHMFLYFLAKGQFCILAWRKEYTLGPAYYEFGYYEHPAITSRFFSLK